MLSPPLSLDLPTSKYAEKSEHRCHLAASLVKNSTTRQEKPSGVEVLTKLCELGDPTASLIEPQTLESFTRKIHHIRAQLFSEAHHVTSSALAMRSKMNEPALKVYTGSIMVHMEGFDQKQPSHIATMKQALTRLSQKFPTAGLILQLGSKFYRYKPSGLEEVPWVGRTPPPVVTRMSAIKLPRHGRCVLVEGEHLHTKTPPCPVGEAAKNLVAMRDGAGIESSSNIQLLRVEDQPLVLYCIQSKVLQAEKLQAMFSTPDGKKALFAAPVEPLLTEGTVTLRLRRGHAFSPDVTMTTSWLQASVSEVNTQMGQLKLAPDPPASDD